MVISNEEIRIFNTWKVGESTVYQSTQNSLTRSTYRSHFTYILARNKNAVDRAMTFRKGSLVNVVKSFEPALSDDISQRYLWWLRTFALICLIQPSATSFQTWLLRVIKEKIVFPTHDFIIGDRVHSLIEFVWHIIGKIFILYLRRLIAR